MKKNVLIYSLLTMGLIIVGGLFYNNLINNGNVYFEAKYIADFSDNKKVSWFADNIFVWKIIKNLSLEKIWKEEFDRTEFNIEVLYNIKWNLTWSIIASQAFGYDENWNPILMEWSSLMNEWEIYIISSRWDAPHKIIAHPNGIHLLSSDKELTNISIKQLIKESKKVKDWKDAYKNEVYYQDNFKISSDKNSYKSLSEENKKKLDDIENGFVNF